MPTHYADRLADAISRCGTPAVVGVDPVLNKLPVALQPDSRTARAAAAAFAAFGRGVIDAVAPHVPAVKINSGFFEALFAAGVEAYYQLVAYAHERGLLVIGDIKRGDIGSTAQQYAAGHLAVPALEDVPDACIPDAVTLAGYLGENAIRPFIEHAATTGRGMYVLVRPSEPKADEVHEFGQAERFYQHMARLVDAWGRTPELLGDAGLSCVGAVVAAKDGASTAALRAALPHTPLLVPGYGAQGGTAEDCRPLFRADGSGAVINASRSVIYAFAKPDYADRFGDDWQAAVAAAGERFAADVAPLMQPQ